MLLGDPFGRILHVTSSTRPTGSDRYTGQYIYETDTLRTLRYNGVVWVVMDEPWQAWTGAQIDQGASINIAKTTNLSRYRRSGTQITWEFRYAMTAGGTAGSALTINGIPAQSANNTAIIIGVGLVYRGGGVNTRAYGAWEFFNQTSLQIGVDGATGFLWGASPNAAIASGDVVAGAVTYEYVP